MMERLTARSPKNNMAYLINVKPDEQDVESPYPNTLRCIMDSFDRLAAYEDSGLSPEQVQEMAKAKADGRLVVLSTPMIPLVESDDPMDSDVYCPACGVSVSGGWPDYHPDLEWKMCQCPHCGQSIDDTKTITREAAEKAIAEVAGE